MKYVQFFLLALMMFFGCKSDDNELVPDDGKPDIEDPDPVEEVLTGFTP
ncbi:MAG: hypothetical protein WA913_04535 [Pricia sp.]